MTIGNLIKAIHNASAQGIPLRLQAFTAGHGWVDVGGPTQPVGRDRL